MTLYLDRTYVQRLSGVLSNLTQKSEYLWNVKCPLCGDSKKSKTKARGYFYRSDQSIIYHCHNCNRTLSLRNFLKEVSYSLYSEYMLETITESNSNNNKYDNNLLEKRGQISNKIVLGKDIALPTIASLSFDHFAKAYVRKRKIPEHFWDDLYYATDFKDFTLSVLPNYDRELYDNEKRLVIPCRDEYRNLIGWQGRSLDPNNTVRYITIKADENSPKLFGMDRVNTSLPIRVVEGPIDSMFLTNCVASLDSNLMHVKLILGPDKDYTFIFDNEPRNAAILSGMKKAIDAGDKVVIWPEYIKFKDINDMIVEGLDSYDIERIIENNTKSSLTALFAFTDWKKA